MPVKPIHAQQVATQESNIELRKKNLAAVQELLAPAKLRLEAFEQTFTARRLKMRLAKDEEGIKTLTRERAELTEEVGAIEADIGQAERELKEEEEKLRRIVHGDLIDRAVRQVGRFCEKLRKLDEHQKQGAAIWREVWEDRVKLMQGWPGGIATPYGHAAMAQGGLLTAPDLAASVQESMWRHSGTEFISAQHNSRVAPSFPGAKTRHPLKLNPADNRTLTEAADHAENYLVAMLRGTPWDPSKGQAKSE